MGQSAPTVSQMMDRFESRYAGFRAELPVPEQRLFDRLVAEGHRHGNALNRHPELDFERPLFLAFLIGVLDELERDRSRTKRRLVALERNLEEVSHGESIPARRLRASAAQQPGGVGQARLRDVADGSPVPA